MPPSRAFRSLASQSDVRSALGPVIHWLGQPQAYRVAIVLGVVLALPALFSGLSAEDHLLRATASGTQVGEPDRHVLDLFHYVGAPQDTKSALADRFGLWAAPTELRIRLFRPLASLTHAWDHWVWPNQVWLMHAHSVAWYAVLIGLAGALYRNFLGASWIAAVATILFAIDDSHGTAVGGLVHRHVLLAACLACLTVAVHDRFRRDQWAPGRWLGPVFFLLALAAGSHAAGILAFVAAYAWVFDEGEPRQRVMSIAPYVAVAVLVEIVRRQLGFSVDAWPGVIDPWSEPLGALGAVLLHIPARAAAILGLPWLEFHGALPAWVAAVFAIAAVAATVAAVRTLEPLLRNHRVARYFAAAALLGICANVFVTPHDASLLLPSLAFMGLVAQFFAAVIQTARAGRLTSLRGSVLALFLVWVGLHVVMAPLLLPVRAAANLGQQRIVRDVEASLPAEPHVAEQQLIIVRAPDLLHSVFPLLRRATERGVLPASARILTVTEDSVRIERPTDDVIVVHVERGLARLASAPAPYFGTAIAGTDLSPGDRIEVGGFAAVVEAVDDVGPTRIRFRFDVPCDNESLNWIAWDGTSYRRFLPPPVGRETRLP